MIDKSKLVDGRGHPLTQSLFLENGYILEHAVYTLKMWDHEHKGVIYPSLGKLFLEMEDVVEYDFANTYLLGWNHWKRLYENKLLTKHIDSWRDELEHKIRATAVKSIIDMTANEGGNFQAAKWLVDKGWVKNPSGRPNEKAKEKERKFVDSIRNDYGDDIDRLKIVINKE